MQKRILQHLKNIRWYYLRPSYALQRGKMQAEIQNTWLKTQPAAIGTTTDIHNESLCVTSIFVNTIWRMLSLL